MIDLIRSLYGKCPREFACPQRRDVETFDNLIEKIDEHNGLTHVFTSAFAYGSEERDFRNALIDKAIFDFDDTWEHLVDFHHWLEERDVAHLVVFSGSDRSGHVYVLAKPTRHQQSLEYFQKDICVRRAGLRICKRCGNSVEPAGSNRHAPWGCPTCGHELRRDEETELVVDGNLLGDVTTHVRIPNTWHPEAERFCIPLRPSEVTKDPRPVYELAQSQRDLSLGDVVSGSNPVDLTQHREKAEERYHSITDRAELRDVLATTAGRHEPDFSPDEMWDDLECECVRSMLTNENGNPCRPALGHTERRYLLGYLSEQAYNPAEMNQFLEAFIDEAKAAHSIHDESQALRIYEDGVKAPNKLTLKRAGWFDPACPVHANATVNQ